MTRLLPFCLPAAVVVGAGAYLAADRAVLTEIGLSPGRDGLRAVSGAAPRPGARPQRIAQGGPVCFDVMLWPGGAPLPLWPADYAVPAVNRTLAALVPVSGVSVLAADDVVAVTERQVITAPPADVPEPPAIALFASALALLAFFRRHA
ncbi:PEP-CTERM sorting domain-containing protein [Roseomonas haemaphysalidis]|uniref:PEP-CTERM sorting domain-containing protein n=1 Tax=Roseomonas haemaphysalidis TaxID=2768162 RepID=A0ABS3KTQ8_9PROT|nr:PEP-CTERM sorting domain-containing protein [Roseomonas haemaphysalidis]MBO1080860.1 PEP-CTERM sorting domain-containing protein [Roseomonas haemaphysalidis]